MLKTPTPPSRPDSASAVNLHIGRRLRQRRLMVGLTQEQVAKAAGVAFQQIQKYESAVNRVSSSRLWVLSKILTCPVSFFYAGIEGGTQRMDRLTDGEPAETTRRHSKLQATAIKLIRSYNSIRHPKTRENILNLAKSLAAASVGPTASTN